MNFKYNKYEILIFLIVIIQIFYQFTATISLIKIIVILISLFVLWSKPYFKLEKKFSLFFLYVAVILISSLINLGNLNYSIKEFLVGIIILTIPLGFYYQITKAGVERSLKLSSNIQKIISLVACIVLIYVFFAGTYVDYGALGIRLSGEAITPSVIALNANLLLMFCLLHFVESRKKIYLLPVVFALVIIILALSKSGIIIALLGFIYVTILKSKYKQMFCIIFFIFILGLMLLPYQDILNLYAEYSDNGSIETLSGRNTIWETCQYLINMNPFLGYGYNSVVVVLPFYMKYFQVDQAHSAYYESMINVGLVGTVLLGMYILKVLVKCIINFSIIRKSMVFSYFFFILLMGLIRGYTEASFSQANNIVEVFLFYISLFLLDFYVKKNKEVIN